MSNLEENSFEEKEENNNNNLEEKTNSVTIKYRNILIFIFFTLIISLSLISYLISLKNDANFVYLDNWEYTENVKEENTWIKISEPKNPVGIKNKSLLFKTELPDIFFKEPCVFIYSIDQLFEVYLDNKLIYSFGDLDQKPVFLGYPINFISLEKYDYKGKELKIKVYSNHTNIGLNGKIKFGERESLFRKVIFDDIDKFIYASIFIMLGIISFALFFTSKNKEKIYINFGFFSLLTGLYAVAHNSITRLLVDNLVLLMYLDLFFLYSLPAFYNFFVEEIATKSKKVFSLMGYTFLAYAFISLFLAYNNEVKLMSTLAPFHILLILNTIGILIYISFKAIKGKREARIFLLGNAIFLITVFYDINNYIRTNEEQYVLHNIGILALFSSIIIIIIERYAKIYTLVSVYYNDLKYQKELQKKLQDAHDSAIENARLKADFLANMSHEIRTPINGVIGMTELLVRTKLDTTQKEFLDIIRISSKNLLEIINNILDFSKIEANKVELDIIEVNINTIIEEVIVSQSLQAYEKGLELMYFIDPKVPETIKTDPIRLKQILTNLFSNSVKFTSSGYIYLHVKSLYEGESLNLVFSVKDTGVGIPKSKTGKLFNSFTQVDTSITRKFGGTGLGLAISARLVTLLGGEISINNQVSSGTEFIFNIKTESESFGQKMINSDKSIMIFSYNNFLKENLEKILLYSFKVAKNVSDTFLEDISEYDLIIIDYIYYRKNKEALNNAFKYNIDKTFFILSSVIQSLDELPENCFRVIKPIKNNDFIKNIFDILEKNKSVADLKSALFNIDENVEILSTKYKLNILVAEDNVINQKVILKLLKKLGYEIQLANNGLEALKYVEENDYDLIFMDVQMPDMDGYSATAKIIELKKEKHPKIIALTANATEHDKRLCLDAGMSDYMSKPISLEKIENTLIKWGNILYNK